jgi:hypothetical protein
LNPEHIEHLYNEGFSFSQIALWVKQGLRSLTQEQAEQSGFKVKDKNDEWVSGSGLYFPFKGKFGQLRLDVPIERKKGSTAKYLTPLGAKTQARIPSGCKVVTEGAKDAALVVCWGEFLRVRSQELATTVRLLSRMQATRFFSMPMAGLILLYSLIYSTRVSGSTAKFS